MRLFQVVWQAAVQIGGACTQTGPSIADSNCIVRPVVTGIGPPAAMAFLTGHDFLVIEKHTGEQ